jgi:hypothetical protein
MYGELHGLVHKRGNVSREHICERLGQNGHFDWGTLAQSKFTFTTHCPIDKNFIDRCHQMGVRCFPYVSFYFGPKHCTFGPLSSNSYEGVDFSQHPEFFEKDQNNHCKPWEFKPPTSDGVGVFPQPDPPFLVCPNFEPYQQQMIAWVNYIMQQGADGIYIDNLRKRTHCYAQHAHIYHPVNPSDPDFEQNQAFSLLLTRVREVVKSIRPDGLILGNTGDPLGLIPGQSCSEFQQALDADTIEGYVCGPDRLEKWQGKLYWDQLSQQLQPYLAQGKQILAISGMKNSGQTPPDPQFREDAFLCYCAARLAGITWYGGPMNDVGLADLHRVRLGKALTVETTDPTSQVHYRVFEHGIVAVNWNANVGSFPAQTAAAVTAQSLQFFFDLFTAGNTPIDINTTAGLLAVPPQSGRVFLFGSSTDYGLNRLVSPPVKVPVMNPPVPQLPPGPPPGGPHTMS